MVFVVVYGSPLPSLRKELWEGLYDIVDLADGPSCLGGDFNYTLSLEDVGDQQQLAYDSSTFNRCLLDYGLSDLGFCGQPFTWQRRTLRRKLDKVVANGDLSFRFGNAVIKHLPNLKSDHVPLLIDFNLINLVKNNMKPFRFPVAWLLHENSNRLV